MVIDYVLNCIYFCAHCSVWQKWPNCMPASHRCFPLFLLGNAYCSLFWRSGVGAGSFPQSPSSLTGRFLELCVCVCIWTRDKCSILKCFAAPSFQIQRAYKPGCCGRWSWWWAHSSSGPTRRLCRWGWPRPGCVALAGSMTPHWCPPQAGKWRRGYMGRG